ncbi:MAG: aminoacyl-tRNA hydrolase [Bacteroidales bacterium]|nr:aminoacyl-tRNA hydrolase [Bacteroidales bacterium]MBR5430979.1 aminoacyl-tRNA hydrolase [Bacteroidales bacterium]
MNFLVAGLGNIGPEYALTRHNMGFMILDSWAQESGIVFSPGRYGSTAQMSYKGRKIYLLKPSTYMNLSGNAVRYWQRKYKIPLSNLIVICDDINLPFGTMRLRKGGSAGGHNGLEHIELCLGTKEYARIRLGIGKDFEQGGQIDYVLGRLSDQELAQIPEMAARVLQGIREFCTVGADFAMNTLNIRPGKANI